MNPSLTAEEGPRNVQVCGEGAVSPAAHAAPHAPGRGEDARHQEEGDTVCPNKIDQTSGPSS